MGERPQRLPPNWPESVQVRNSLSFRGTRTPKSSLNTGVSIREIRDPEHPACGECGLFSAQSFAQFDVIGEYVGKVMDQAKFAMEGGPYVAETCGMKINAEHEGNEVRFINDYRGIGESANVTFRGAFLNCKPHLLVIAMRDVEPDEELLVDYGSGYWSAVRSNQLRAARLEKAPERAAARLTAEDVAEALPGGF